MKKLNYLLMLFVLMIIVPTDVLGELASDNKHILMVEKMEIKNSKIVFEGYSFISHMDNWGVLPGTTRGNLETYLLVYSGDVKNSINSIEACENKSISKGQCAVIKADMVNRDMFYSRCTKAGCSMKQQIVDARGSNGKFDNTNNCNKESNGLDGDCLYTNVGFHADFFMDTLIDTFRINGFDFEKSGGIHFKILSKNIETGDFVLSTFNVRTEVCTVNGIKCKEGKNNAGVYSFVIPEFATKATMDATYSTAFLSSSTFANKNAFSSSGKYFKENKEYNILSFVPKKEKVKKTSNVERGTYFDSFVLLDTKKVGDKFWPDTDNSSTDNYYAAASHMTFSGEFYISSFEVLRDNLTCSNIKIDGKKIQNNTSEKNIGCGETAKFYQCLESNPSGSSASVVGEMYYLDPNPQCTGMGQYKIVHEDINGDGVKTEDEKRYYLKVKVSSDVLIVQSGEFNLGSFTPDVVKAGKGFSIESSRPMTYKNSVTFIIAGRYKYLANSIFNNTPFINYSATRKVKTVVNGVEKCRDDTEFSINDEVEKYYSEFAKDNYTEDSPFYYNTSSGMKNANSLGAAIQAISESFFEEYAVNYDNNINNDIKMNSVFKFESCKSNSSDSTCDSVGVNGNWDYVGESFNWGWVRVDSSNFVYQTYDDLSPNDGKRYRGFGKKFISSYKYNLPYAYVALSDMTYDGAFYKYADVVYSTTPIANSVNLNLRPVGNKYFVGLKYVYDNSSGYDFPFDLKRGDVSLVEGMTWMLSGTCGVDVEDGYYTCDDPGGCDGSGDKTKLNYKYRSINVKAPFPKFNNSNYVNAATNWQDWYWTSINREINRQRLSNSYNTLDYSVTFSKYPDASKLDITEIINCSKTGANGTCSSGYGSMTNFGVTGRPEVSRFVNKYFNVKPADNKYCGLGLFSPSCDKYS